jgi:NADH-quinone oxidoreductase subunit A
MVYFIAVLALVASMLGLSWLLGQRHHDRDTDTPYEAGVAPTGSARLRFATSFYLVALSFVIFDLEVVFLFAWATAARELGWSGYVGMLIFMGVLAAALFYEWRLGILDGWGRARQNRQPDTGKSKVRGRIHALVVDETDGLSGHAGR